MSAAFCLKRAALLGRLGLFAALLVLGGCEGLLFASLNITDTRRSIAPRTAIVFDAVHHLALDFYRPARAEHAPIVVFFYGGSWVRGKRQWYRFVGTALAARGIIVVIPDYRKYPQVGLDGYMHDAAEAVRWAHSHATELGGNPNDLFVMGHSSGGHIGALLATNPAWLATVNMRPNELAGFIGLAGVYSFVPIPPQETDMLAMFGHDPASQYRAEPLHYVDGAAPPMLLLHGLADHEVDPANSRVLAQALIRHDDDATLHLYPDVSHMGLVLALARPAQQQTPTLDDIVAFIRAHPGSH